MNELSIEQKLDLAELNINSIRLRLTEIEDEISDMKRQLGVEVKVFNMVSAEFEAPHM